MPQITETEASRLDQLLGDWGYKHLGGLTNRVYLSLLSTNSTIDSNSPITYTYL
jgi:hypothetical protein